MFHKISPETHGASENSDLVKRRTILMGALGLTMSLPLVNCGGGSGGGSSNPAPSAAAASSSSSSSSSSITGPHATVSLQRSSPGSTIGSDFMGISLEKDRMTTAAYFNTANTGFLKLLSLLGPSVMRVADWTEDTTSWNGAVGGQPAITAAQVDNLAAFIKTSGWKVVYGINFVNNSSANAAAEASYVAAKLGSNLQAFEIGNEPDEYAFNGKRATTYNYPNYLAEWRTLRSAIATAVPGASFVGPSTVGSDIANYPVRFAKDSAGQIINLSQHYYIDDGLKATSTIDKMLQPDPVLLTRLDTLVAAAAANGIAGGLVLSEANSFYNHGSPGISNSYASALWVLDFLFTCSLHGCRGVYLNNTGTGPSYSPLIDVNGVITEVRSEFYAMAMFARAAQGIAVPATVTLSNTAASFTAYGVLRSDGGVNIVLVNKDPVTTIRVDLDLGISAAGLTPLYLNGTALASLTGQTLGGAAINTDGSWAPVSSANIAVTGTKASLDVAPISAVLLRSV